MLWKYALKPYFCPLHKRQAGVLKERIVSSEASGVGDARSFDFSPCFSELGAVNGGSSGSIVMDVDDCGTLKDLRPLNESRYSLLSDGGLFMTLSLENSSHHWHEMHI